MTGKIVHLMRGLPSCGKSHRARRIAGEEGLICETDAFFHSQVGEDPARYDYDARLLPQARQWNFERFRQGVDDAVPVIVVDRGNSFSADSAAYARYAAQQGYSVVLSEPDSRWWQEIRVLLKYKRHTKYVLFAWAERLSRLSRSTHRVPLEQILHLMARWRYDLTVEDILGFEPAPASLPQGQAEAGAARGLHVDPETGTAHDLRNVVGRDSRIAPAAGVEGRTLPADFRVTTGRADPVYFDAATGGVDGGFDGGAPPIRPGSRPLTPDLIFDEQKDEFVRVADKPVAWSIDGSALQRNRAAGTDADGGWIVEGIDAELLTGDGDG